MAQSTHQWIRLNQNRVSRNFLNLIIDFLDARKQRVVLNGQYFLWTSVEAGVPQGSVVGHLFFLIVINDLSDNLVLDPKLFAEDTSLFLVVQDITLSAKNVNDDLKTINNGTFSGNWVLIRISTNKHRKLFFPVN